MTIKAELTERLNSDLEPFGMSKCAEEILHYISRQPYRDDFYISLTELSSHIHCEYQSLQAAVNYLSSSRAFETLRKAYCVVDSEHQLHELDNEELATLQETKKLYLRHGGQIDSESINVFLLYKTNVGKVAE